MSSHPLPLSSHPITRSRDDQQVNPVLHTMVIPKGPASKKRESIRPLSTYTADQIRVLECRCRWARKIHGKSEQQISAELDVRMEDLETLCPTVDAIKWQVPDPHGLAEFRARQKQGLGPDDLV